MSRQTSALRAWFDEGITVVVSNDGRDQNQSASGRERYVRDTGNAFPTYAYPWAPLSGQAPPCSVSMPGSAADGHLWRQGRVASHDRRYWRTGQASRIDVTSNRAHCQGRQRDCCRSGSCPRRFSSRLSSRSQLASQVRFRVLFEVQHLSRLIIALERVTRPM